MVPPHLVRRVERPVMAPLPPERIVGDMYCHQGRRKRSIIGRRRKTTVAKDLRVSRARVIAEAHGTGVDYGWLASAPTFICVSRIRLVWRLARTMATVNHQRVKRKNFHLKSQ